MQKPKQQPGNVPLYGPTPELKPLAETFNRNYLIIFIVYTTMKPGYPMHRLLCVLLFLFVTQCLSSQERGVLLKPYNNSVNSPLKGDSGKRKAALIVGISDYSSQKLTLKYANKDAGLFFNYLTGIRGFPEENIFMLPDSAATSGRIYNSILDLMKWLVAGDELVLYFAGHGDVQTVADFDEAFFLAWDASDSRNYFGAAGTLKLSDLELYTNRLAGNKKVKVSLIMDACHAGFSLHKDGILKAQDNINGSFDKIAKLLGCGVNEFSYEADSVGHGLFTWYLVQGMMGLADDPADNKVTIRELNNWVKNRVSAATKGKQNPVLSAPGDDALMMEVTPGNREKALAISGRKLFSGNLAGRGTTTNDTLDLSALQSFIEQYNYFLLQGKLYGNDSSSLGVIKKLAVLTSEKATELRLSLQNHLAEILESRSQLVLNEYLKGKSEQPAATVYFAAGTDASLADSLLPENDPRKKSIRVMEAFHKAYSFIRYKNFERYPEAEYLLRNALKLEDRAAYIYVTMSYLMEYHHKYDSAIYYAKKAEAIIPTWNHPKNVLGNLYENIHQYEKALDYHRAVLKMDSSYVYSYNNIGVAMLGMNRLKEAEHYFTKSLEIKKSSGRERLNRDWSDSYANLAAVFMERGYTSKAERYYALADSIDPSNTFAIREMSTLYEITDGEKVASMLKNTIVLMPYEAENYCTLADFYRENSTDNRSSALSDSLYRIAIRLNPFDETPYAGLGYLMLDEKKPDSAFIFFTRGVEASGGTAESWYNLGWFYKLNQKRDIAVARFKKALQINPYNTFIAVDLSRLLLEQGDTLQAEKILIQSQALQTQSPKMYFQLGNFYFITGRLHKAVKQYEQCLGIDESYLNAIKALVYTELLTGNDKNSRRYMKQLMEKDKDPFLVFTYINAVAEQAYEIPPVKRTGWLNGFLELQPANELLNELIAETAYSSGKGYPKAFLQTKRAEEKSEYNQPVLIKWLLLLAVELNDIKQMKLYSKRYLDEVLNADPIIQSAAMKLSGKGTGAKKIKKNITSIDLKPYQPGFKKIFSGI